MEYSYMVVAFINGLPEGKIVEPPKHAHITVKKKFKLIDITETELVDMLQANKNLPSNIELQLGNTKDYGSSENQIIEVLNPEPWINLHNTLLKLLGPHIESRDPHFEDKNYYPHVTWKLKGAKIFAVINL